MEDGELDYSFTNMVERSCRCGLYTVLFTRRVYTARVTETVTCYFGLNPLWQLRNNTSNHTSTG